MTGITGQFGDTSLTKVFVGGLAWETPVDNLRAYFDKFGTILEAVIISDKFSGRSKGYGFVTFKDPESARNACEDPAPIINGRRANCNIAAQGSRRTNPTPTPPPPAPHPTPAGFGKLHSSPPPRNVQWYFPATPSPFHHQRPQPVPFYGCTPAYIAADYNQKVSWNGGSYYPQQMYRGGVQVMRGPAGNLWMMPMYPQVYYHPHQLQAMGQTAHMFPQVTSGPFTATGPITDPSNHQLDKF